MNSAEIFGSASALAMSSGRKGAANSKVRRIEGES